jgi:tol-pal system protein YbgF
MFAKALRILGVLGGVIILLTGCLKTRAQLKEDGEDREATRSVAVQPPQEVRPQSQYVIDEMKDEMTRMEGRIEDLERNQKESSGRSRDKEELKKLTDKVRELEEIQLNLSESLKKLEESISSKDPSEIFEKAKSQFKAQDYEAAAETLGRYLKVNKGKKSEEAIMMRGECYYKLKQYKKAIVEYSKFPEKFSRSAKMPEALYKIGLSFDALNMKDDAKGFYQELVEKYPKSPEAKKARKKGK